MEHHFVATIALIGIVIVVASLMSGLMERSGIPLVGGFLLLGAALGPYGLGLIDVGLHSPVLRVLAVLSLALVLFSDAVNANIREIRERRTLAWLVVGPGTVLPALLIALAAYVLLDVSQAGAAIIGAALASTDPVMLRSVLRSPALPPTARVALRLESGSNDVVLLPIVALAIGAAAQVGSPGGVHLGRQLTSLFVVGPALGALVGWVGITILESIRSRVGVRRDYESLYALGLAFAAYAAAELAGGSGFLAAFAAGLAIAALDVELCDCFLEYGEATSEMLLLLAFVALGTSLIWTGVSVVDWRTVAFASVALVARTAVLYPVITRAGVAGRDRTIISLLGPRGLSSLLLALLPVFSGIAGASRWFTITCFVVLLSMVIHGALIAVFLRRGTRMGPPTAQRRDTAPGQVPDRITADEALALRAGGEEVVFADARAPRSFEADERQIAGAVRISPDDPVRSAETQRLARSSTLALYCA